MMEDSPDSRSSTATHAVDLGPEAAKPRDVTLYDPRPGNDRVRARITVSLLLLVAALTLPAYACVLFGMRSVDEVAKLQGLVAAPILSLAGSVVAYYFATTRS